MKRFLVLCVVATLLACGPKAIDVQARAASAMAVAVNGMVPVLRDLEQKEGDAAIDKAPDKASARLAIRAVAEKWMPLWDAEKALQTAQDSWAKALEQGGNADSAYWAVHVAFCRIVPLLPKGVTLAPISGVVCGGA